MRLERLSFLPHLTPPQPNLSNRQKGPNGSVDEITVIYYMMSLVLNVIKPLQISFIIIVLLHTCYITYVCYIMYVCNITWRYVMQNKARLFTGDNVFQLEINRGACVLKRFWQPLWYNKMFCETRSGKLSTTKARFITLWCTRLINLMTFYYSVYNIFWYYMATRKSPYIYLRLISSWSTNMSESVNGCFTGSQRHHRHSSYNEKTKQNKYGFQV